jgi:cytochrome P450/ferredoxin-NADP reductase
MKIPESSIDFFSDEVILNPYSFYSELRALGPVVYLTKNNLYALSRYQEVSSVLRQPLRFVSSKGLSPIQKVNDFLIGSTLNSDPPEHDESRAVTSEPLLPGALKAIEPKIKSAADGLVDVLCERQQIDAVTDLAQFLPLSIVVELVGLPDKAGADNMLKWASATFNLFGTANSRTASAFDDLAELGRFLQEYGRPEKLKSGGWAKRIFDIGPERGLSKEKCAKLMRDYIAPSLDTTISTTAQIIKFFADYPEQWQKIRQDASLIPNAVEEAVRMATPIRAFTRYAIEASEIAGHTIPEGERVLVIYASANRDERKFNNPDQFDVTRDVHDHVGFGQGVHMCMGMHLARREIILLLEALRRRVEKFELTSEPTISLNNTIRAYSSLPVKLHIATTALSDKPIQQFMDESHWINAIISKREQTATDILALEIQDVSGNALPAFDPGAHIDVEIKSGLVRQYSLSGDPQTTSHYELGILKDPNSRGGSVSIYNEFKQGHRLRIGKPRNNFMLHEAAEHSILFAGGVGITPILCMARALSARKASWELHYCVKSPDRFAFKNILHTLGQHVHLYADNAPQSEQLKLNKVLAHPNSTKHLYVCGPNGFMDYIVNGATDNGWTENNVHLERFGAEIDTNGSPFTVVARKSGIEVQVNPGETIADNLRQHGINPNVSCQSGVCGTCLTPILEGIPDHRDLVQTEPEKAANTQITICCSRSKTRKLVLDL